MGKIKIVQLLPTMADGGAETLVKDYALLFDKDKFDMTIISWSEPLGAANESILRDAGINVIFLGKKKDKKSRNLIARAIGRINNYMTFRNYIIREKVDVVHIHLRFGLYTKMLPRKVLKRIKLFYTVHNEPDKYFDPSGTGRKKKEYLEAKRLIDKYGLTMITLHEEMNQLIRKLFNTENVITINNGINFDRFDLSLYDKRAYRDKLGVSDDEKLIGHVGSFTYQKNHDMVLAIFEEYLKENKNSKLLLVGKGVLKQQIIEKIDKRGLAPHIIMLENRTDIPELMSAMDVFLLPSRWEGFPVVMIEAQKMGLPCVISDKINSEVVLSENVTRVSLESTINEWIDAIDGKLEKSPCNGDFVNFDIRTSIRRLQGLYMHESKER